jgi:hypothetical protein
MTGVNDGFARCMTGRIMMAVPTLVRADDDSDIGEVNAADYVVWRNGLGTTYEESHYEVWRSHFGQSIASGAAGNPLSASAGPLASGVPEPSCLALLAVGLILFTTTLLRCPSARATR